MNQDNIDEQNIPGMNLDMKYSKPVVPQDTIELQKEMEKTKKELDKLKAYILKKYPFTQSISVLPPQTIKSFTEEEEVPKETEKHLHIYVIIPEEEFQRKNKDGSRPYDSMKKDIIKQIDLLEPKGKQKIWLQIKTPVDLWETCLDSKFDLFSAIAMSFPVYDRGFLGALRISEIHKSLVLQKFERYVVSYVIAGSFLRGTATKTSDIDVFIIINDTDVKRMPRLELKERLRNIIYQYVAEATALAGVKNNLHIQPYLLTDFWESVKDAHPVIFTFIRDGIPIYDRGTFMPWKSLLKMGKLKPSPEAIDMFMKSGEKTHEIIERRLIDAMIDVYYGVLTPSQALIMLYGAPPPTHKETPSFMKEIFVDKEKMLEKKYITILEKVVKLFKEYEHDLKFKISGSEVDKLVEEYKDYMKRLKELREQIEKRTYEKTIEQIYADIFSLLKTLVKAKSQTAVVSGFEKNFVKKGKFTQNHLRILKDIIAAKNEFKRKKLSPHKIDEARKNASILINDLIEYTQRQDLVLLEKGRMRLRYGKEKIAEILTCDGISFLFKEGIIKKITNKIEESNMKEVSGALESQKSKKTIEINPKVFELLKKELGDYEIVM